MPGIFSGDLERYYHDDQPGNGWWQILKEGLIAAMEFIPGIILVWLMPASLGGAIIAALFNHPALAAWCVLVWIGDSFAIILFSAFLIWLHKNASFV